jgi:pyrimidine operon attenuation protein/uracil phosphoribosyltransferase
MNPGERRLCDDHEILGLIASMARKLADARRPGVRLCLGRLLGQEIDVGAVDITLYRDDLGRTQRWPVLRGTEIAFSVDGVDIVLVDDVLFTGRTIRAALNAICDLGRPACVRLAVLVDRGHREIPIQPDVVGLGVATELVDHVTVRLRPADPIDEVVTTATAHRDPGGQRRAHT